MQEIVCQIVEILIALYQYVKANSIDFISMVASILIAIETNKWIERQKGKKDKKHVIEDLISEIDILSEKFKSDQENEKDNILSGKLTLKLFPYNSPVWNSIKNTDKINLLTESDGYKDTLEFYSEMNGLNEWENALTHYVLFSVTGRQDDDYYKELLVEQVSEQREKVITLAEKAHRSLKEG